VALVVLALLAVVVVSLSHAEARAAGVRRNGRDDVQSAHGAAALHSIHVSRRWLLGRASEMCRLMINMGLSPKKVWIQGSLHVSTKNNPNCQVFWGWHVAPTLCVRGPKFFQSQQMVIDPSLFATPVSQATWKGVQGDPGATLTPSAASIFYLWGNVTDPGYVQTNQVLANYRLQLQNRSLGPSGPPPYANCP